VSVSVCVCVCVIVKVYLTWVLSDNKVAAINIRRHGQRMFV
jgi:hypothetical protein